MEEKTKPDITRASFKSVWWVPKQDYLKSPLREEKKSIFRSSHSWEINFEGAAAALREIIRILFC
jgi:hypothetical protein